MDRTHIIEKKRAFKPFDVASQRFQTRAQSADALGYGINFYSILVNFVYVEK